MCGICGIIYSNKDERVEKDLLRAMNDTLAHRGPDDEGFFVDNNIGLAMKRLSIIDLETGHQPVHNEDETIWVIQNGEIYNYLELREDLIKKGHKFYTKSDTEVIIHLYEDFGEDFVHKLQGMFAIALWDKNRDKLLIVRDRIGIKPLYYYLKNGVFLFASEIKVLLKHPQIEGQIRIDALSDYLTYLYIPAPKTIYKNIYKLLPGHMIILKNGVININRYWELNYKKGEVKPFEYYKEKLEFLLKDSVKKHLISDVPLGVFLSGGVDSSTIVAIMKEVSNKQIRTFSVGFDVGSHNELKFAKLVSERFNTKHEEIYLKPDIISILPKIAGHFDEPFADSSTIPTYLISKFAREYVKVVLAGDGGDELFAGYSWTRRQKFIQDYNRLPDSLRKSIRKILLGKNYSPDRSGKITNKLRRFVYDANLPLEESFLRRATCFSEKMKKELFKNDFSDVLRDYDSSDNIRLYFNMNNCEDDLEKLLFIDTKMYLPDDGLKKVDMMSMFNSLEIRVPLLDHKVVEFTASIPFEYKMKGRKSKYIVKEIMKNRLPNDILKQRKLGFTIPVHKWFRDELKSFAKEKLLSNNSKIGNFLEKSYVNWIINTHISGEQDLGYQIYSLLFLELWLEGHELTLI